MAMLLSFRRLVLTFLITTVLPILFLSHQDPFPGIYRDARLSPPDAHAAPQQQLVSTVRIPCEGPDGLIGDFDDAEQDALPPLRMCSRWDSSCRVVYINI